MTLNWGHKLVLVFLVFGASMSFLVYRSVTTNFELVSKEYYKDEIEYQQVIDGTRAASQLSGQLQISQANDSILIRFPNEMSTGMVKGRIWFYYAPDARRDRKFPIEVSGIGHKIAGTYFLPGNYTVKTWWEHDGKQYYNDQKITIR